MAAAFILLQFGGVASLSAQTSQSADVEGVEFRRGVEAAERDISHGQLVVLRRGMQLTPKSRRRYAEARDNFLAENGIRVKYLDDMTQVTAGYRGYRQRMDEEIRRRFGEDVWEKLERGAAESSQSAP